MKIIYVQFIAPVNVGGDHGSIESWSDARHDGAHKIEEKGSWITITCGRQEIIREEGKPDRKQWSPTGDTVRVPITNVAYIKTVGTADVKAAK